MCVYKCVHANVRVHVCVCVCASVCACVRMCLDVARICDLGPSYYQARKREASVKVCV